MKDGEDMEMPCICPECEEVHELDDAKRCLKCRDLFCPDCINPERLCPNCRGGKK